MFSTSYNIRELQMKSAMSFYTPIRLVEIQNADNTKYWWGWGAKELSFIAGEIWNGTAIWETVGQFPTKLAYSEYTIQQSHLLVLNQMSWKSNVYRKTYMQIFIATLFIIVQTCKQHRWYSVGKWMNKLWNIYTVIIT